MNRQHVLVVGALLAGIGTAAADPIPLAGGKVARLTNRAGTTDDKAIVRFAQDPQLFTLDDPCAASTALRLTTSTLDTGSLPLPCAKWRRVGAGFRYDDPTGAVQRIVYRSRTLRIKMRGPAFAAASGPVSYVEARFSVGPTRYCGRFTTFTNNTDVIVAKGPTSTCQPICGDGNVDGIEQCDDGNTANGDCCSSTCQFETGACSDGSDCTIDDTCVSGACVSTVRPPWINEFDYDDFTGILDDRDEFVEIAAPAGTDLGGYKLVAVEGNLNGNTQTNGAPCYSDIGDTTTTGNPNFIAVIPPGTVVGNDTGTGIGFLTACFTNTSTNHEVAGECDIVLPAPATGSNLKNGYLLNVNQVDCPDGILLLDQFDAVVDALSYEGLVPDVGLFGGLFQTPPYNVGVDEGWVPGVSIEKRTSTLSRALSGSEWHLSGGCTTANPTENPRMTTLSADITAGDTTVAVVSTNPSPPWYPAFPSSGTVRVDNEELLYSGVSATTLTGVSRGVNGTTAAAHAIDAAVTLITGCTPLSNSPHQVNPGQILACNNPCGNGVINAAAGEECDPQAVPSGCGPAHGCVAAGQPGECTCVELCGNGVVDAGEECDPPGAEAACAGGQTCNADCSCPPPPSCMTVEAYHRPETGINLCTALVGGCQPPVPVSLAPAATQLTFELCFRAPDSAGRVAMTIAPETYLIDAEYVPAGGTSPIALTQRYCQAIPATGTLFTLAGGDSYPAKRCLTGDPAKLLRSCAQHSECDGPTPTAGNGICGTRDIDYTSVTTSAGTNFAYGNGSPDPAGALLVAQRLNAQVFLGLDVRCPGDGVDTNCVLCDAVTPAPAGRIGVLQSSAVAPTLILPLETIWSTGSVENKVVQAGNLIDGREVGGSGVVGDAFASGEYEIAAANSALNVPTPLAPVSIQFLTKNLWRPQP